MPCISSRFQVNAPLEAVSFFHHDTRALIKLTPPLVIVRLRRVEPLGEGSVSEFTLWFGPLPVRWKALHTGVDSLAGFTDTQVEGPLEAWVHTHHWKRISQNVTQMEETITYRYPAGVRGLAARLLFAPPLLKLMLAYRKLVIQRETRRQHG